MIKTIIRCCFFCLISGSALAENHQVSLWRDLPIQVSLSKGQERLIQFESPITLLRQEKILGLDIFKLKKSLLITPKALKNQRLMIQLQTSGDVVLIDLLIDDKSLERVPLDIKADKKDILRNYQPDYDYNAIQLTRYAIQSLYSPQRLTEKLAGITKLSTSNNKVVKVFTNTDITSKLITTWRAGSHYVTAVHCENTSNKSIQLKKQTLYGKWQTASFYPKDRLAPKNKNQATTLILVSAKPFRASLNQAVRWQQ